MSMGLLVVVGGLIHACLDKRKRKQWIRGWINHEEPWTVRRLYTYIAKRERQSKMVANDQLRRLYTYIAKWPNGKGKERW